MIRRKRFTERQVIETLIRQGMAIYCYRSRTLITLDNVHLVEREHLHELALGGPDIPDNCRYSLKAEHHIVTNGTKATVANSSKHRIAKARQGEKDRLIQKPKPSLPMSMRCRRCGEDFEDGTCRNCGPPVQKPFQKRQAVRGPQLGTRRGR